MQSFAKNIWHFRSLQWQGPQWKSLFWANEKPHHVKNQFSLKPPSWFSLNICFIFGGSKIRSYLCQRQLYFDNFFFYWEMGPYFWTLFEFRKKKNTLMTPLTYSALLRHNGPSSYLIRPCQHIWVIYLGSRVLSPDKPLQELPILTLYLDLQDSVRPQSNCHSVVEGPN